MAVVGIDVSALAASAKRAGYSVFSVDYFGDSDLKQSCIFSLSVITQRPGVSCGRLATNFHPHNLLELVEKLVKTHTIDGILLSSGLEDDAQTLAKIHDLAPIIGNHPTKINQVRTKPWFFRELDRIGVKHPTTRFIEKTEDALEQANEIGFPIVIKPETGFGGYGVKKIVNAKQLYEILNSKLDEERFLIQDYVDGIDASASVISTASNAFTLTVNEQLLGLNDLGQQEPFGYCGNVVPLDLEQNIELNCRKLAEKVIRHFGLIGSNGVDFVITHKGDPLGVEVIRRFQGPLEFVVRVLTINLVKTHIDACSMNQLPHVKKGSGFCSRLILYALKRTQVPSLSQFELIRDIPVQDSFVEQGEPLCSVVMDGATREIVLHRAQATASAIYRTIANSNKSI
ncbi:MAG: ATP-grasp domain-containing protein [Candidatus Bathyarchaeota archaeon]|nr:MAG: ATP-grasp domain-containing protein [Candidatus Bathyarchaeota archaeon]